MPTINLGMDAKLYYNSGTYATPSWEEITVTRDVTVNNTRAEADVTTRGNDGWRAIRGTLKDMDVSFQMLQAPDDPAYSYMNLAYLDGTIVDLAVADGDIAQTGTHYWRLQSSITQFSETQPLEEAVTVDVTARPTENAVGAGGSNVPPDFVTVP